MHKLFIVTDVMSVDYSDILSLYSLMPEGRQIRCDSYRHETDRRLSILSYALLLYSLYSEYGTINVSLDYTPNGKPYLRELPQIYFNLSHCNKGIALAISSEPVGVDIETFDGYDEKLIDSTMSPEESALIRNSQNCGQTFILLWTKKEAFVKFTGKGIEDDMKDILKLCKESHIQTFVNQSMGCAFSVCAKSELEEGFMPQYMSADVLCRKIIRELPVYRIMSGT